MRSNRLQFTCEVWQSSDNVIPKITKLTSNIKSVESKYFLYLDLELYYSKMDILGFKVHLKDNQKLKYLNSESTYNIACI